MDPDSVPTGSIVRSRDKSASCCCAGAQVVSSSSPALTESFHLPHRYRPFCPTSLDGPAWPTPARPASQLTPAIPSQPSDHQLRGRLLAWWPTAPLPRAHTPLFPTAGRCHRFLLLQIPSHCQATVATACGRQDVAGGALWRLQAQPRSSLAASALTLQLPRCTEALSCCCRKGVWRTQVPSL